MKTIIRLALIIIPLCFVTSAYAMSPAPIGSWYSDQGSQLHVNNGYCIYKMPGNVVQGDCDWNASYGGGVLTIHYVTYTVTQIIRNNLYFNISWVNKNTISVFGATFHRR